LIFVYIAWYYLLTILLIAAMAFSFVFVVPIIYAHESWKRLREKANLQRILMFLVYVVFFVVAPVVYVVNCCYSPQNQSVEVKRVMKIWDTLTHIYHYLLWWNEE
jgi:hypothetical protein